MCRERVGRSIAALGIAAASGVGAFGCGGEAPQASAPVQVEIPVLAPEPSASAAAIEPEDSARAYKMNKAAEDRPTLLLTRVTVESDRTTLRFTMTNRTGSYYSIMLSAAGSEQAMFLLTPDGTRVPMRRATGIALKPDETEVKPGAKRGFTVIFDALPADVTRFDIYEGEPAMSKVRTEATRNLWVWRNVELK